MQRNAVRWGMLALFADGPKYGYQLRTEFDARTGGTWALNVGQLYTTLERLDRDGLVASVGANDEGRTIYAITDEGRTALADWFATPVTDTDRPRSARGGAACVGGEPVSERARTGRRSVRGSGRCRSRGADRRRGTVGHPGHRAGAAVVAGWGAGRSGPS